MAVTYGFYNSVGGDRKYDAVQMSKLFDGILNDGVYPSVGTALTVEASGGMSINIGPGRAWFNRTWTDNDAVLPLTVEVAEIALKRIDAVVIEVNTDPMVRANTIKVVKGLPSSAPVKPEMVRSEKINQYALAYITLNAGVASITQSDIEIVVGNDETPFVTGILETMSIDGITALLNYEWTTWFSNIKDQLDGDVAGNLQNQINDIVTLTGTTPPTTSTSGVVGQLYLDTTGKALHLCVSANTEVCIWNPVVQAMEWGVISTFDTPGTFEWTAPDLYGTGAAYEVVAIIDGGGASGQARAYKDNNAYVNAVTARGGFSGERKIARIIVFPGQVCSGVVGAGGSRAVAAINSSATQVYDTKQNPGKASSFAGVTALGGASSTDTGGQVSDLVVNLVSSSPLGNAAPFGGMPIQIGDSSGSSSTFYPVYIRALEREMLNPFNLAEKSMSAGGTATAALNRTSSFQVSQGVDEMDEGVACPGYASLVTNAVMPSRSNPDNATSRGSGGGAMVAYQYNYSGSSNFSATSGAGAAGRVRIYARRLLA